MHCPAGLPSVKATDQIERLTPGGEIGESWTATATSWHDAIVSGSSAPTPTAKRPIRLAIVNDYGLVVAGLAGLLAPYADRVSIVELSVNMPIASSVDVVLYDTFARPDSGLVEISELVANARATRVAVFSWYYDEEFIEQVIGLGAAGFLSKTLDPEEIIDAVEAIVDGEIIVIARRGHAHHNPDLNWPGRDHGLTAREAEVLALVTQGKSNAEITELLHLSINTIKVNIRHAYRKIGARNRVDAVLWGIENGMQPEQDRFHPWRADAPPPTE